MRPYTLNVWNPDSNTDYIVYPGEMDRSRLEWAKRDCNTGEVFTGESWRTRGVFAGRKILIHANVDPAAVAPLRAFIDVGHYPSNNFHFAWLDPSLSESHIWTYESLLAVLNGSVSQVCMRVARTRNNPTDLIEKIPLPQMDRESIDEITEQVAELVQMDPADSAARNERIKAIDEQILA